MRRQAAQRAPEAADSSCALRTKEIVARAAIDRETLRFYEKKGLLPEARRTRGGYRQYPSDTVERIAIIRAAKGAGFSLEEIRRLFALRTEAGQSVAELRQLGAVKLAELAQRRAAIDLMYETLSGAMAALEQPLAPDVCRILHAYRTRHTSARRGS